MTLIFSMVIYFAGLAIVAWLAIKYVNRPDE